VLDSGLRLRRISHTAFVRSLSTAQTSTPSHLPDLPKKRSRVREKGINNCDHMTRNMSRGEWSNLIKVNDGCDDKELSLVRGIDGTFHRHLWLINLMALTLIGEQGDQIA
jgi:hypothetical protein